MPVRGLPAPAFALETRHGVPIWSETAIPALIAHIPVESNEMSSTEGSPVRSRLNSAAEIPPAIVMPPIESP